MRRIGVNTWVWTSPLDDGALRELAPKVAGWGFDTIEMPVENPGDWAPDTARALLADLGLVASVVLVMPPGRELVRADAGTVTSTQDYLRSCVDVAAQVGSPVVAGPAYTSVGRTWRATEAGRAQDIAQLRDNLAPVLEYARQAGVTVAVEPLNRYETSLLNTVEQTLAALDGLPACGVALDFYHQNIEETDIPAAIRSATGRIAHVQVCANDRGTPGRDHLDWPALLAALDDAGYDGPLCIESFTAHNASIATAASIWRPLATSQDDLAADGLAFLKSL
ncbi:sugar phosphate isomerase/epimerase family protein [Kibdelosporangium phytohabitans]|uniref:Sugar phosphate isomerase n=1 Tax=Kibdelosporangium phytohabitans TaxID=860235 RepID=A0A0N9IA29_9PSEU|nr:sugar phosphate isomerase/epimerase family protein [Kibdelosporangium phytohabitans]ALG11328.1 sugar phosphate isomerase [Kibdelosporangium phytohabitans]MBE1462635.1 D-psicose/D-tagatose/L-ribulose 3-epimerase [Kibdelosporangium phytohabitans]